MDLTKLEGFARRNLGLVTRRAAMSAGWSNSAWSRALRRGVLQLVHPGVARVPGTPITLEHRIHAAVLAGGRTAVAAAIASGVVSPTALFAMIDRHSVQGRSGVGPLREAVSGWLLGGKPADSLLEVRMAALLRRAGLPSATFHPPPIAGYEVDFLVDGTNVVLECIGWEFHARTRAQMERDAERNQVLALAGCQVFEFTWAQVTRDGPRTARRIRDLLARWAPGIVA